MPLLANGAEVVSLNVGIVGSKSSQGLYNPVAVVHLPAVTQLLPDIADEPRTEFVTFGDHDVEDRWGFPDLIWRVGSAISQFEAAPPPIGRYTSDAMLSYYRDDVLQDIGRILLAARNGATTVGDIVKTSDVARDRAEKLWRLLVALQYFDRREDRYCLIVPMLGEQYEDMLDAALKLSNQIMVGWLDDNYDRVKADLGGLTAIRHGVPYEDLYTQIWHYTFGLVNRELVRTGFFQDPYDEARASQGFIPFAFLVSIYADEGGVTQ